MLRRLFVKRNRQPRGMTMIELVIVLGIAGVLAQIAVNELRVYLMRAKRTEAVMGLNALWKAQKAYLARHNRYAGSFDQLDFSIVGGKQIAPDVYQGGRYTYQLSQPWGPGSFYCIATAQLDGDPWPDVLEMFEKNPEGR
jgi:prepilin-type N-terminal cleavage/methylation domain-containing protein